MILLEVACECIMLGVLVCHYHVFKELNEIGFLLVAWPVTVVSVFKGAVLVRPGVHSVGACFVLGGVLRRVLRALAA
ncbi:hypothetical protein SAMN04515620_101292 [Collimonas sp. OK607]|nr:hypothetical protein SAMN04515620_101292 [Collimonas sp. OK607]